MNREILFKAKRIDNGEWVEGLLTVMCGQYHIINQNDENTSYPIDSETICQYTGLTDENGNKIWENDIVDFLGRKGNICYGCGSFGIYYNETIDWEEIESNICTITGCDNALYACKNDNFISLWEIYWNFNDEDSSVNTVEVIGNIFDNKELLKGCDK